MTDNLEELERRGLTPLDNKFNHKLLDVFREGSAAFDSGAQSPYHGHSLEHCLHSAGWVQRDLRVALDKANASLIATAREVEGLRAEVARLRAMVRPQWFYLGDDQSSDQCHFSVSEVIDEDFFGWGEAEKAGKHLVHVSTAMPGPDIWVVVQVLSDEDKDERGDDELWIFEEYDSEEAARAALEGKGG